jgi:soluble lytic murein transglycosylase-like protein
MGPIQKILTIGLFFALFFLTVVPEGSGKIWVYIDQNGDLFYTNRPTFSNSKVFVAKRPPSTLKNKVPNRYDSIVTRASKRYGISSSLIKAVIKVESDYDPKAVSKSGAMGLMQSMPENARSLNLQRPYDPSENIMAGARYLKYLMNRFDGKLILALAAYNAGPGNVDRFETIPPFQETEAFVAKVMTYYHVLKYR